MTTSPLQTPPNWPRLAISIDATGGTVTLAGTTTAVAGAGLDDTRLHALEVAIAHATRVGRPLYAIGHDPVGTWLLVVNPDGKVEDRRGIEHRMATTLFVTAVCIASLIAAGVGAAIK